jgi:hypothetical protein
VEAAKCARERFLMVLVVPGHEVIEHRTLGRVKGDGNPKRLARRYGSVPHLFPSSFSIAAAASFRVRGRYVSMMRWQ